MSTKIIKMNRGDSFELSVIIPDRADKNKHHLLSSDEILYFALLNPNQRFEEAIFIKGYELEDQNAVTGEILVKITPYDTRCLTPGVYYYTAKLQKGGTPGIINDFDDFDKNIEVRTIIERTKFIINE